MGTKYWNGAEAAHRRVMMKAAGCEFLFSGIYIKFDNPEIYKKFCSAQIPGVVELW